MKFTHCNAYTFGRSIKIDKLNNLSSPGPGQYPIVNTSSYKSKAPLYSMAGKYKLKKPPETPGPKYILGELPKGPQYSIGHVDKSRDIRKAEIKHPGGDPTGSPGPGAYNMRGSTKVPVTKFGTDKKCKDMLTSCSPGPMYDTSEGFGQKAVKFSFGKEERGYQQRGCSPGPAKYDTRNKFADDAPKFSFSKDKREILLKNRSPGPIYQLRKPFGEDGHKISMSPCGRKSVIMNKNPGPGKYEPDYTKLKLRYPTYRIGTAKRRALYESTAELPAPNAYNPNDRYNSSSRQNPSWKMGTSKRGYTMTDHNPGVGLYNVASKGTSGPRYTLRSRHKILEGDKFPGPGQYNEIKVHYYKEPAWKMGTSKRDGGKIENFPGPGNYNAKVRRRNSGGNFKFGTEKRGYSAIPISPGPGQYKIPCEFDNVNQYIREQGNFDNNFKFV